MNTSSPPDFQPEVLQVIDRLEVGPVRVEKQRLVAPYLATANGRTEQTDLIYHFGEPVFTPGEPQSENLAAMIAAQVALNYGLFCREIVFRGRLDKADRQFLTDMAENTAREIYVIKLLHPNPFLRGDAVGLPPVKRQNYLPAELVFPSPEEAEIAGTWKSTAARHAILSSGGKDSLLTHGLISELGLESHPVFINESGRHWYTALNAYRHFREQVPNPARVWTNADRLFAWMLRHLPFIRKDFASVRSDDYPIRLWTVAVFLFGALPLLRKRGIGRLLIGDEYDTTRRLNYRGIPHYDGLYDQSRYFDNALTRYFMRKRWNICQFSILRPLSEMLIETILTKRYPELQRQQVSCHAAHIRENRVYPCGQCEKCRRIVGMLSAIGADPGRCGYSAAQIEFCLKNLARQGIHQESAGAQHMLKRLAEKGKISLPSGKIKPTGDHPEIMKIRFDPQRSPLNAIPADLRAPLLRIFREYAGGTVKRTGNSWTAFRPETDPDFHAPYPYAQKDER